MHVQVGGVQNNGNKNSLYGSDMSERMQNNNKCPQELFLKPKQCLGYLKIQLE